MFALILIERNGKRMFIHHQLEREKSNTVVAFIIIFNEKGGYQDESKWA